MNEIGNQMEEKPLRVSLIVTTFNCVSTISDTLQSALAQDYPNLEIVIVDGGSGDGTVDVVRRCAEEYPEKIRWVSKPDRGIYDAMNKGIRMASGDILAVFNDLFTCEGAVSRMVSALADTYDDEHVLGAHADLAYVDGGKVVRKWVMGDGRIEDGWMPAHPTLYMKRSVYERYGVYDIGYHSSADYEFMIRILSDPDNRLIYVPEELIHMYYGGTSNGGVMGYARNALEAWRALKANQVPHAAGIIVKRVVRTMRQFR